MSAGGTEVVEAAAAGGAEARAALERTIAAGGVAVFPADGLYGLACDPLDAAAVARIHRLKGRDEGKSSAVMYFSTLAMRELVSGLGPRSAAAAAKLLPGPVTLILANPRHRYPLACREDRERLGVRLIDGPLAGAMCPIFQTSANRSGEPPPSRFAELAAVDRQVGGLPSTVVDIAEIDAGGGWTILREGALSPGDLAAALDHLA